ncbi:MAG: hypothetical protein JXR95_09305 [Deltaproteobacteria bacterium]|nr:hypothetical protein [Deltaproteobacteria bacterium]
MAFSRNHLVSDKKLQTISDKSGWIPVQGDPQSSFDYGDLFISEQSGRQMINWEQYTKVCEIALKVVEKNGNKYNILRK